jgi:AhpC/TSA family
MIALVVGIAVLGVIELFHIAVTTALIRRVREGASAPAVPDPGGPGIGEPGPRLDRLRESAGDAGVLVGFFSAGCDSCAVEAPRFAAAIPELGKAGLRPVAVFGGPAGPDRDTLTQVLTPVGTRLFDGAAREAFRAFAIKATPAFFLIHADGTVRGKGTSAAEALISSNRREPAESV